MNSVMRCHNCFKHNLAGVIFFLLLITHGDMYGIMVGSDTAVAIEPFYAFQQTATNNMMLGFAATATVGFALATSNTCTWNAFFPTGSTIYLNGGTLNLSEDIIFSSNASIYNSGTINANNRAIIFENESSSTIPKNTTALSFINSQNAVGAVYSVDWSSDNLYVAAGTVWQPSGYELRVYSFNGVALTLVADIHPTNPVPGNLYELAWSPMGGPPYYLAVATANDLRAFQFTPTSGLVQTGVYLNGPAFQAVSWHPSGNIIAAGVNISPYITVCSLSPTGSLSVIATYASGGIARGALSFDYTGSYLAAGISGSGTALQVLSWNVTTSTLSGAASVSFGSSVYSVAWSPDGTLLAVGLPNQLQIYSFNRTTPSLTQIPSYTVSGFSSYINSISWSPDGSFIAIGVSGNNVFQLFAVNRTAQQLSLLAQYSLASYPYQIKYSSNEAFIATADNFDNVSVFDFSLTNTMIFANAAIQISGDTYLKVPLIFQGTSVLDGHNCALYLGNTGSITVASGASLLLKNVNIYNVAGTNINCLDNTGTLSFYNVTWSQDSDVTFTQGQLAIVGSLVMTGNHRFIYESDQTSTIYDLGNWYFDNGMTFSYAPLHGENNLIAFQDNQSILYLYGTTLYASSTGLRFTDGCLKIEGQCQFISDATIEANGIWIGDGNPSDDVTLKILPESGIITGSGYVSYGNTY